MFELFEPWVGLGLSVDVPLLMVIGTIFSLALTIIVYYFSFIINKQEWQAFAKKEIGQIFLNFLLFWFIFFIIGFIIGSNGLMENVVLFIMPEADASNTDYYTDLSDGWEKGAVWDSSGSQCLFTKEWVNGNNVKYPIHSCIALKNIHDLASLDVDILTYIFYKGTIFRVFSESSFNLGTHQWAWETYPGEGYKITIDHMQELFDLVMISYVLLMLQYYALDVSTQIIFPLFLVIGMLLRNVYFLRRIGGFLVALGLALYFVSPLIYMVNYHLIHDPVSTPSYLHLYQGGLYYQDLRIKTDKNNEFVFGGFDKALEYATGDAPEKFSMSDNSSFNILDPWGAVSGIRDLWSLVPTPLANLFLMGTWFVYKFYWDIVAEITKSLFLDLPRGGIGAFLVNYGGWTHMVARILMFTLISPILSVYSLVASIKTFSAMLGGESKLLGLSHFL